jgi:periplasmic copper chaperone A
MRLVFSASLVAGLFALAACSGNAPAPEASASAAGVAAVDPLAPENAPSVSVLDPVVKLPVVPGNPGVLYFTIQQDTGAPGTLAAVHVDGAGRAEMHETKTENGVTSMASVQTVTFGPGKPAEFKPGGYHVTLSNGDKVSTFAAIEAMGGDMGAMGHM